MLSNIAGRASAEIDKRVQSRRYVTDPVAWATEYLGVQLWSKQREILMSLVNNRQTAVKAGHSTGKSWVTAVAIAWWVDVHPLEDTFVASTAPSVPQLRNVWDTLRKLQNLSKARFADRLVDHPLPGYITNLNEWKLDDGTVIAQGRKPPDARSDTGFQGRHAPYLLAIGDEAVGLPGELIESLGNIATGKENRQLLIMNPTDPTSAVARIWRENDPKWSKITISSLDSPAIKDDPFFDMSLVSADGGLATLEFIEQKKIEYGGEDDPRYIARVLGEWAFDSVNNVFTEEEITKAGSTVVVPFDEPPHLGVDISRHGEDSSWVYIRERGQVWRTNDVGKPVERTDRVGYRIRALDSWQKMALVGNHEIPGADNRVDGLVDATGASVVKVDATGLGSGLVDSLVVKSDNHYRYVVVEVMGARRSSDNRAYLNSRAELYFSLKRAMFDGLIDLDPEDTDMLDELRGITYSTDARGALKIDTKDELRKNLKKSPDRADAVTYAFLDVDNSLDSPLLGSSVGDMVFVDPTDVLDSYAYNLQTAGRPL